MSSVTGVYFDDNGKAINPVTMNYYPGVLVNASSYISACGNHFHRSSGNDAATAPGVAHILFQSISDSINFCGNVYRPDADDPGPGNTMRPNYVYDAMAGAVLTHSSFYENPGPQVIGVLSPAAVKVVGPFQVLPATPHDYFSALGMSNSGNTVVSIAVGQAIDSTNSTLITNAAPCTVDLSSTNKGLGYIDIGGPAASSTTYFFFVVTDATTGAEGCMAATTLAPMFTYVPGFGAGRYRLVGALYTVPPAAGTGCTTGVCVVQFMQDGDTFYLASVAKDVPVGTCTVMSVSGKTCPLSVPCGRIGTCVGTNKLKVEAFGRASVDTGTQVILFSPDQPYAMPQNFPAPPGFSTSGNVTSFPFRLFTNASGNITIGVSAGTSNVYVLTDGWVLPRSQPATYLEL